MTRSTGMQAAVFSRLTVALLGGVMALGALASRGQEIDDVPLLMPEVRGVVEREPHRAGEPMLPHNAAWSGVVIILAAGLFLAAAVVGPMVRSHADEPAPDTHGGHGVHGDHAAAAAAHH